ncbi:MAG TPA: N-formylglutamate amidohydrolase [Gammaproteobacteria bacterium]|nr:N-formylglutamate amidohydrolase [Gammaproteobacteria bacterium]
MDSWTIDGQAGEGAVLATAIHNGHALRPDVQALMVLDEATRLREEDPHTDTWAALGDVSAVVHRSRFEMDLNRPLESAVYLEPDDAWGLRIWKRRPPQPVIDKSRAQYRAFYKTIGTLLDDMTSRRERVAVLDFHAYNHRRGGPDADPEPQEQNPDINIGTHDLDLERWGPLVAAFAGELRGCAVDGRPLDVRCNVKFKGRQFPRWVDARFPNACALAIEVKKIYMDEWTGQPDPRVIGELANAFRQAIARLRAELGT